MTELLPCPFCGGEASVERIGGNGYYFVACTSLNCCDSALADTKAEAIDAWNTREERTCKHDRMFNLVERECDGKRYSWRDMDMPNYCPNCGAKVVGE